MEDKVKEMTLEEDCESNEEEFAQDLECDSVIEIETNWKTWDQAINNQDFSTPLDHAVFWTGYAEGNKERALQYAVKRGKMVLESTPGGKWLEKHNLYDSTSFYNETDADSLWYHVSEKYVKGAKGHVVAFTTRAKNPNSIYQSKEKPYLLKNSEVFLSEVYSFSAENKLSPPLEVKSMFESHKEQINEISRLLFEAKDLWESISTSVSFKKNKKKFLKSRLIQEIPARIEKLLQEITHTDFSLWIEKFKSIIGIWNTLNYVIGDLELKKVVDAQIKQGFNVRQHLTSVEELLTSFESVPELVNHHYTWLKEFAQFIDYQIFLFYRDLESEKGFELATKWKFNVRRFEESHVESILKSEYKATLSPDEARVLETNPKIDKVLKAIQEIPSLSYNLHASDCHQAEQEKWNYLYDLLLRKKVIEGSNCDSSLQDKEFWQENIRYYKEGVELQERIAEKAFQKAKLLEGQSSLAAWQNAEEDVHVLLVLIDLAMKDLEEDNEINDEDVVKEITEVKKKQDHWFRIHSFVISKLPLVKLRTAWREARDIADLFKKSSNSSVSLANSLVDKLKNAEELSQSLHEKINIEKGGELKQFANIAKSLLTPSKGNENQNDSIVSARQLLDKSKKNDDLLKQEMNCIADEIRTIVDDADFSQSIQTALLLLNESRADSNAANQSISIQSQRNKINLAVREIALCIVEEILEEEKARLQNDHEAQLNEIKEKVNSRLNEIQDQLALTKETQDSGVNELLQKERDIKTIGEDIIQDSEEILHDQLNEVKILEEETAFEKQIVMEEKIIDALSFPTPDGIETDDNKTDDSTLQDHQHKLQELIDLRSQKRQEKEKDLKSESRFLDSEKENMLNILAGKDEEHKMQIETLKAEADIRLWFSEPNLLIQIATDCFNQTSNFSVTPNTTREELMRVWDEVMKRGETAREATDKLIEKIEISAINGSSLEKVWTYYCEKAISLRQEFASSLNAWRESKSDAILKFDKERGSDLQDTNSHDSLEEFHSSLNEAEEMEEEAQNAFVVAVKNQLPKAWKWVEEIGLETEISWKQTFEKIPASILGLKKVAALKLRKNTGKVSDQVNYWEKKLLYIQEKLNYFKFLEDSTEKNSSLKTLLLQVENMPSFFPADISSEETLAWKKEKEILLTTFNSSQKFGDESKELEAINLPTIICVQPSPLPPHPPALILDPMIIKLMETALLESYEKMKEYLPLSNLSLYTIERQYLVGALETTSSTLKLLEQFPPDFSPSFEFVTRAELQERLDFLKLIDSIIFHSCPEKNVQSIEFEVISIVKLWRDSVIQQLKPEAMITFLDENIANYLGINQRYQQIIQDIDNVLLKNKIPSTLFLPLQKDRVQIMNGNDLISLLLNIWEADKHAHLLVTSNLAETKTIIDISLIEKIILLFERASNALESFRERNGDIFVSSILFRTGGEEMEDCKLFFALECLKARNQVAFWQKQIALFKVSAETEISAETMKLPDEVLISSAQGLLTSAIGENAAKSEEIWSPARMKLQNILDLFNDAVQRLENLGNSSNLEYWNVWRQREKWRRKLMVVNLKIFTYGKSSKNNRNKAQDNSSNVPFDPSSVLSSYKQFFSDAINRANLCLKMENISPEHLDIAISMVKETAETCLFFEQAYLILQASPALKKNDEGRNPNQLQDIFQAYCAAGGFFPIYFPDLYPLASIHYCYRQYYGHDVQNLYGNCPSLPPSIKKFIKLLSQRKETESFSKLSFIHSSYQDLEQDALKAIADAQRNRLYYAKWEEAEKRVDEVIYRWSLLRGEKYRLHSLYFEDYYQYCNNKNIVANCPVECSSKIENEINIFDDLKCISHSNSLTYQEREDRYHYWIYQKKIIQNWKTVTYQKWLDPKFTWEDIGKSFSIPQVYDGLTIASSVGKDNDKAILPWWINFEKEIIVPLFSTMKDHVYDVNYWKSVESKAQVLASYWTTFCPRCLEHPFENYPFPPDHECWKYMQRSSYSSSTITVSLENYGLQLTEPVITIHGSLLQWNSNDKGERISDIYCSTGYRFDPATNSNVPNIVKERPETPEETAKRRDCLLAHQRSQQQKRWKSIVEYAVSRVKAITELEEIVQKHQNTVVLHSYNYDSWLFHLEKTIILQQQQHKSLDIIDEIKDHLEYVTIFRNFDWVERKLSSLFRFYSDFKKYYEERLSSSSLPLLKTRTPFVQDEFELQNYRDNICSVIYAFHRQSLNAYENLMKDMLMMKEQENTNPEKEKIPFDNVKSILEIAKKLYETSWGWYVLYNFIDNWVKTKKSSDSHMVFLLNQAKKLFYLTSQRASFIKIGNFVINENLWDVDNLENQVNQCTRLRIHYPADEKDEEKYNYKLMYPTAECYGTEFSVGNRKCSLQVIPMMLEKVSSNFERLLNELSFQSEESEKDENFQSFDIPFLSNLVERMILNLALIFPTLFKQLTSELRVCPAPVHFHATQHKSEGSFIEKNHESSFIGHSGPTYRNEEFLLIAGIVCFVVSSKSSSLPPTTFHHLRPKIHLSLINGAVTTLFGNLFAHCMHPAIDHYYHMPMGYRELTSAALMEYLVGMLALPLLLMMKFLIDESYALYLQDSSWYLQEIQANCHEILCGLNEFEVIALHDQAPWKHQKTTFQSIALKASIQTIRRMTEKLLNIIPVLLKKNAGFSNENLEKYESSNAQLVIHNEEEEEIDQILLKSDLHGLIMRQVIPKIKELLNHLEFIRRLKEDKSKSYKITNNHEPKKYFSSSVFVPKNMYLLDFSDDEIRWSWNLFYLQHKEWPKPYQPSSSSSYYSFTSEERKFHEFCQNELQRFIIEAKEEFENEKRQLNSHSNEKEGKEGKEVCKDLQQQEKQQLLEKEIYQLLSQSDPFREYFHQAKRKLDDLMPKPQLQQQAHLDEEGGNQIDKDMHSKESKEKDITLAHLQWKDSYVKCQYAFCQFDYSMSVFSRSVRYFRNEFDQQRVTASVYWESVHRYSVKHLKENCWPHLKSFFQTSSSSFASSRDSTDLKKNDEIVFILQFLLKAWKRTYVIDFKENYGLHGDSDRKKESMFWTQRNSSNLPHSVVYDKQATNFTELMMECLNFFASQQQQKQKKEN